MEKRREEISEPFAVTPERMFEILITPAAVRGWFGASTAVIDPRKGGSWVAAYGEGEGDRDFVNSFRILEYDPPRRLFLGAGKLLTENKWPIATNITTDLLVEPHPGGCTLRIIQELDPHDALLDDYFDACIAGWQNSFEGIRNYLHRNATE